MAIKAADHYRQRQEDLGRPVNPREPLKRTADNNWVHVTCAVFTPEIKFGNAKTLEPSEGIPSIPRGRFQETCKICKSQNGACVFCQHCRAPVHVECAYQAGYVLGFDITPVKGSRRDQHNIVTIGNESGTMTAGVWCKDHPPKTPVYLMHDLANESGTTALQLYARNFKQADLTLTGCARKANLIPSTAKASAVANNSPLLNRRASSIAMPQQALPITAQNGGLKEETPEILQPAGKVCITCGTDLSPKWYALDESQERSFADGYRGELGPEARKFMAQRNHQCHKCKKAKRQPRAVIVKEEETTPPPPSEVSRSSAQAVQAIQDATSPHNLMSVNNIAPQPAPQQWDQAPPARQTSQELSIPQPMPIAAPNPEQPLAQPTALMPPSGASGPPPAMEAPLMAADVTQSPQLLPPQPQSNPQPQLYSYHPAPARAPQQQLQYGRPYSPPAFGRSYNEWRQPSSQHGPPPPPPPPAQQPQPAHHTNGGHSQGYQPMPVASMSPATPVAGPSHHRQRMPHQQQPALQNGHAHNYHSPPPTMNGMPPSPRGYGGPPSPTVGYGGPPPQPPMPNGRPYYQQTWNGTPISHPGQHPTSHHQSGPPHPHHRSGPPPHPLSVQTHQGPPPPQYHHANGGPRANDIYNQPHRSQRSPFTASHGSPPGPRESAVVGRDGNSMPQRPPENRSSSGASANPALRNLLD